MKKMKDIYEAVISEPNMKITVNYEWRRHESLAGNYPDGKAVYYQKEMAKLRETMTEGKINLIVASWIKSNFVITLFDDYNIFEYWDKINEKELMEKRKELLNTSGLVKSVDECMETFTKKIERMYEGYFRSFLMDYFVYKNMKIELEKIGDETPEDDKPKFTRAGARAIFDKIRSLDMGWKDEKGKQCLGIKEDDPEPFICMVLHKKPTKKMTWIATTPNDKSKVYVKAIVEMMSLIGYSLEEISPSAKAGYKSVLETYFNNLINYDTLRTKKSEYEAGRHSPKYERLEQIINAHKSN